MKSELTNGKFDPRANLDQAKPTNKIPNMKTTLVSIPGAGYFIVCGNKSSKCFKTAAAAKAALTRGTNMSATHQ